MTNSQPHRPFGQRGANLVALAGARAAIPSRIPPPQPSPSPPAAAVEATAAAPAASRPDIEILREQLAVIVADRLDPNVAARSPRRDVARQISDIVNETFLVENFAPDSAVRRDLVTFLINGLLARAAPFELVPPVATEAASSGASFDIVREAKTRVQPILIERIDPIAAMRAPRGELARQVSQIVSEIAAEQKLSLNQIEQRELVTTLLADMLGLGPLEPLLADETITDIMVNGPSRVYVERRGKLELTDVRFRDNTHVMNIATRIVTKVGRRIDESQPLVDARLMDGSRVNIIAPPLAIDGATISIRKFSKKSITLDVMERQNNISTAIKKVLQIAARCRLNILISGGTGSGKTTLLNALSAMIDHDERIVTIEDAAELQLQQPHVVRLETRPANLEGHGDVTMRDLVKNALRMRPDRIILGEVRGPEALDMLQAMNTGHEGSLGTIHANRPRETLTRLENMISMAGVNWPSQAVRGQIASALDLIVQINRMRDGVRRITHIVEVVGMEGEVITTQDLFVYEFERERADGQLIGQFKSSGLRPHFTEKARYFGLDRALLEAMTGAAS